MPSVLGAKQFPAPSAMTWKAVAEVLSKGIESLGAVKALVDRHRRLGRNRLALLGKLFPKQEK